MIHEPTLRQLRTFVAVLRAGSLSAAAREAGVSQPAVSLAVRELERLLGVRLLERDGRRPLPTAAGEALLAHARQVIAAMDETLADMARHGAGRAGRVRIGTGTASCLYELPAVLAAAKRRLPGLEIVVSTGRSPELVEALAEGALDIVVMSAAPVPRSVETRELAPHELVALFPKTMAPVRAHARAEDLAALPLILLRGGNSTRALVDGWLAAGRSGIPRAAMELDSEEAIKVLIGAGLGAGVLPRIALPEGRAPPGTVALPLRPLLRRRQLLAVRKGKVVDRGLRLVIEAIEAGLGKAATRRPGPGP